MFFNFLQRPIRVCDLSPVLHARIELPVNRSQVCEVRKLCRTPPPPPAISIQSNSEQYVHVNDQATQVALHIRKGTVEPNVLYNVHIDKQPAKENRKVCEVPLSSFLIYIRFRLKTRQ
jgi:hypothetical protein